MSNENVETQTKAEDNSVKNPSTEAKDQNVPLERFLEINQAKKDGLEREGKLQAQIDKMTSDK